MIWYLFIYWRKCFYNTLYFIEFNQLYMAIHSKKIRYLMRVVYWDTKIDGRLKRGTLTLILLTWRIWWAPNNASKLQMGFNSAFKGLNRSRLGEMGVDVKIIFHWILNKRCVKFWFGLITLDCRLSLHRLLGLRRTAGVYIQPQTFWASPL